MTIGAISNKPVSFGSESPAAKDPGFSLELGKAAAPAEARIASLPDLEGMGDMPTYCTNAFNRLVRDVNELYDLLARNDPSLEAKLDDLDLRINMLISFCADFLPQSAMNDLRGMRELIDAMRGALGFDADQSQSITLPQINWGRVRAIGGMMWETLSRLAPFFGFRLDGLPQH